ncbi:hypothetical protein KIW84_076232 [Lathyrus oleraceus]|uniref:Uncharacterized protein n=1 Tax=Pisum sativum TaxID=3888 RepID=A0A9D4VYL5_PEA|nr:hypothetical protein KIW84_076232 [Pisum sativum]
MVDVAVKPDDLLSSKIQNLCPTITGNICGTEARFETLRTQVQQARMPLCRTTPLSLAYVLDSLGLPVMLRDPRILQRIQRLQTGYSNGSSRDTTKYKIMPSMSSNTQHLVMVGVEESCCGLLGSRFGPEIRGWIDKENNPGLLSWIQVHGR